MDDKATPTASQVFEAIAKSYATVKRRKREIRLDDRLVEDLDLDSLDAIDMLTLVERELGITVDVDEVTKHLEGVQRMSDLVDIVCAVVVPTDTSSAT